MIYFLLALLALHLFAIVRNLFRLGWRTYSINFLIGLDQFYNALLGGMPDETISSRCGRGYGKRWYWTFLGDILNAIQANHVYIAMQSEVDRNHLPGVLKNAKS